MAISFNNIPDTLRTPNVYVEIDNSRALKGLVQNPHKALIIGTGAADCVIPTQILTAITRDNLADGYFGVGTQLARMCNIFKENNPHTELYAVRLSETGTNIAASCNFDFSIALDAAHTAAASQAGWWYLMVNATPIDFYISKNDTAKQVADDFVITVNSIDALPCTAKVSNAGSEGHVQFAAKYSGILGNQIDVRQNYYPGQVTPSCFSVDGVGMSNLSVLSFWGGGGAIDLDSAWAVIENEQFHYIIQPATDATNLGVLEVELEDRFLPQNDLQGHGFAMMRDTHTQCATLIGARNCAQNTIMGATGTPNEPAEWAAAVGAVAAWNLNNDPARPLHFLKLKGLLPPRAEDRYSREERETHLYDGVATHIVDLAGNVLIERCITTYQRTVLGTLDPSYLDIQTMATLGEIRYQYKARMASRFLIPRFKLADDSFPAQPGSKVVRPKDVVSETIALFTLLRDKALIENLDEFIDNLVVERNLTDRNRIDVLLPSDLINQFRILAGNIQFIL